MKVSALFILLMVSPSFGEDTGSDQSGENQNECSKTLIKLNLTDHFDHFGYKDAEDYKTRIVADPADRVDYHNDRFIHVKYENLDSNADGVNMEIICPKIPTDDSSLELYLEDDRQNRIHLGSCRKERCPGCADGEPWPSSDPKVTREGKLTKIAGCSVSSVFYVFGDASIDDGKSIVYPSHLKRGFIFARATPAPPRLLTVADNRKSPIDDHPWIRSGMRYGSGTTMKYSSLRAATDASIVDEMSSATMGIRCLPVARDVSSKSKDRYFFEIDMECEKRTSPYIIVFWHSEKQWSSLGECTMINNSWMFKRTTGLVVPAERVSFTVEKGDRIALAEGHNFPNDAFEFRICKDQNHSMEYYMNPHNLIRPDETILDGPAVKLDVPLGASNTIIKLSGACILGPMKIYLKDRPIGECVESYRKVFGNQRFGFRSHLDPKTDMELTDALKKAVREKTTLPDAVWTTPFDGLDYALVDVKDGELFIEGKSTVDEKFRYADKKKIDWPTTNQLSKSDEVKNWSVRLLIAQALYMLIVHH